MEGIKRILSALMRVFIVLILTAFLFGCAAVTQSTIEQKLGPPAKKEVVGDKVIYYYYYSGRRLRPPYEQYENYCYEYTFDKEGKLVNKKEYYAQPKLEGGK